MKKLSIAFLAILVLVTFASCNQKALEEAEKREQATIDFFETFSVVFLKYSGAQSGKDGEYDLSKYDSEAEEDATAKSSANTMIKTLLDINDISSNATNFKTTSAKGIIKIVNSTDANERHWTAEGVEVSYQYDDEDSKTVTGTISLSGEVYIKYTDNDEDADTEESAEDVEENETIEAVVKSFVANGKTYRPIELSMESSSNSINVTKAICDNIELNKKMVEAAFFALAY